MEPPIDQEALDARRIELGTDIEEFTLSPVGNFLLNLWEQRISLTCYDALLGKHKKEYLANSLDQFTFYRGFALGIQWVLDDIKSRVNIAKRLLEEKKTAEEAEAEVKKKRNE
jgi:hypothetical protein